MGGKYYITRNNASIAAFTIGKQFNQSSGGFVIAAAHTDSPCFKVRPNSSITSEGYQQLGVDCYGGGLWHTWFDRGLGIAGKVIVAEPKNNSDKKTNDKQNDEKHTDGNENTDIQLAVKFVRIDRPICVLPNLAIHLQNADERAAFKINKETQLRPILNILGAHTTGTNNVSAGVPGSSECSKTTLGMGSRMPPGLLNLIATELQCPQTSIVDVDLCLMDATHARLAGLSNEFIESPRLDNLVSCWAAFTALLEQKCPQKDNTDNKPDVAPAVGNTNDNNIQLACAFDHEEVGSQSWSGANSSMLESWLRRIMASLAMKSDEDFYAVMAKSLLLSCDQAHGVHPNYTEKHQAQHKPYINAGIVLKSNANQRYATHAASLSICRLMASLACPPVPVQDFVVRADSPCGSTIGPMTASRLGISTIDLGVAQFAMHSCREFGGIADVDHLQRFVLTFYEHFNHTQLV